MLNKKVMATALGLALTMAASSVAFAAIASDSEISTMQTLEQQVREKVEAVGKDNLTDSQTSALQGVLGGKGFGHMVGKRGGQEMTAEQKATLETQRAEREVKVSAFKATLSAEQLAIFEQAYGTFAGTKTAEKPTEADREAMKANRAAMETQRTAFEATLTAEQKTAYDAIFTMKNRPEVTDAQKAERETKKTEREANEAAFTASLSSEQAAQYAALKPAKSADGATKVKRGEITDAQKQEMVAQRAAHQAQLSAFVATLSAEQQALYEKVNPGMSSENVQSRIQSLQSALNALN